jgi:hypothetical protein
MAAPVGDYLGLTIETSLVFNSNRRRDREAGLRAVGSSPLILLRDPPQLPRNFFAVRQMCLLSVQSSKDEKLVVTGHADLAA